MVSTIGGFATAVGASVAMAANVEGGIEPRGNRSIFTAISNRSDSTRRSRLCRVGFTEGMRGELHYTLTQAGRFNIAPGQHAPVGYVRDGMRQIDSLRWGLLPRWHGHGGKRGALIASAPIEAATATPQLRAAFTRQRCVVLADGCYAWRELKQPIWYHPEPRHVIGFAGVWEESDDDGVPSFALLLGPPLVTRVNDAMPIVIAPDDYDAWLDPKTKPETALERLVGLPLAGWRADAVSTRMSQPKYDDEHCIAPVGNTNQGELF